MVENEFLGMFSIRARKQNRTLLGSPDPIRTLIPFIWHLAPAYKVPKNNRPSAGAAGGRDREAPTVTVNDQK